jgi:hypothetical protein
MKVEVEVVVETSKIVIKMTKSSINQDQNEVGSVGIVIDQEGTNVKKLRTNLKS